MDFVSSLDAIAARFSFSHYGWTPLTKPLSLDFYKDWLANGHHASMDYLVRHLPQKEKPQLLAPKAKSAIVVAKSYVPHPYPTEGLPKLKTAAYAQGEDYHIRFKQELEALSRALREEHPAHEFLCFTDSSPVLERDLAVRAGLGWVGKNTCVIHPKKGSFFLLGEILTSLELEPRAEKPLADFCGTCDRCIRACPTGAIESPRVLNAGKCISYWTIEAKTIAPKDLRDKFQGWFFGCDICQSVCPWNGKIHDAKPEEPSSLEDLRWILRASHREIERRLERTPLSRARAKGLKRNALYVIANLNLTELKEEVRAMAEVEGPWQELASETLGQLS